VPDDANAHAFASLLEGSGISVSPNADFTTLLWRKLLINSVANPLTALTRQGQMVLRRGDMRVLCLAVLEEAAAVGRAEGARLAPDAPQRTLAALFSVTDDLGTSMYFDTSEPLISKSHEDWGKMQQP
jgi:2-dehydropantoate 2-reductase